MLNKTTNLCCIVLVFALISACVSSDNQHSAATGLSEDMLIHDKNERQYLIYIPKNITPNDRLPLLLVLHGGNGTHESMIKLTHGRFNELADIHKFYVVYPQRLGNSWNDGRNDLKSYASANKIDDVDFFKSLITKLKTEYKIEPQHIFVTGISNGGFMSFRLGCSLRDEIKAIAPVTATLSEDTLALCQDRSSVSLALFNGTDDPIVPYEGGYVTVFKQRSGKITSTEETISHWRNIIGCSEKHNVHTFPDTKRDGTTVTRFQYEQCSSNTKIALYRVNHGGHTWPGGKQYLGKRLVGISSKEINACDQMWKFFSSLASK